MARPSRCRRICKEPLYDNFVPESKQDSEQIYLTVDEYEVIRLVDYEKKTHEECAGFMQISRTTVTEIYESARFKMADCMVNGKALRIAGGNYRLCQGDATSCRKARSCKRNGGEARQCGNHGCK